MKRFKFIIFIFLFSFILRLFFILFARNFINPEMFEFGIIADNLLKGKGFVFFTINGITLPSAYMPPAYPLFLSLIFKIIGKNPTSFFMIECIHAILQAGLCVVVYLIARRIFKEKTVPIISALIVSIYPALICVVTRISAFSFYSLLGIVLFLLLIKFIQEKKMLDLFLASVCLGLLILFRSEALIYIPLLMIWLFFNLRGRKCFKFILTFLLGTIIVIAPWFFRNYIVFHKFVPVTTLFGYTLYRGNNPELKIRLDSPVNNPDIEQQIKAIALTNNYEIERDKVFLHEAKVFLKDHPREAILLSLKKFFVFWAFDFSYTGKIAHMQANFKDGTKSLFYIIPWLFVVTFFIFGLFSSFSDPRRYSLFYLFIISQSALSMLFFVLPRYRLFIEPIVIIIASSGVVQFYERMKNLSRK